MPTSLGRWSSAARSLRTRWQLESTRNGVRYKTLGDFSGPIPGSRQSQVRWKKARMLFISQILFISSTKHFCLAVLLRGAHSIACWSRQNLRWGTQSLSWNLWQFLKTVSWNHLNFSHPQKNSNRSTWSWAAYTISLYMSLYDISQCICPSDISMSIYDIYDYVYMYTGKSCTTPPLSILHFCIYVFMYSCIYVSMYLCLLGSSHWPAVVSGCVPLCVCVCAKCVNVCVCASVYGRVCFRKFWPSATVRWGGSTTLVESWQHLHGSLFSSSS